MSSLFACGPSNLFHTLNQLCPCLLVHEFCSIQDTVYCRNCFKKFVLLPIPRCTNLIHVFNVSMNNDTISIECTECLKSTFIAVTMPLISPIYVKNMEKQSKSTLKRCLMNALDDESRPLNHDKVTKKIKTPILNELLLMIGYSFDHKSNSYILEHVWHDTCSTLITYLDLAELGNVAVIMGISYFVDGLGLTYEKYRDLPLTDYCHESVAPAYKELGCIDFKDDLIVFAFRKALANTKDLIKYTTLLNTISLGRKSDELMLTYYNYKKYVDAFNYFGTSNSNEQDSFYIGLYRIKTSDNPEYALTAKKQLQVIGEYIQSEIILQMCMSSDLLTGLGNSGVSCHLNACLQCLAHIEPFRTTLNIANNTLSVLLSDLFSEMSNKSYVFPNQELIKILFGAAQQQDASECMEKIIDQIGTEVCEDIFGYKINNEIEYIYRLDVTQPILSVIENKLTKFPNVLLIQINVLFANAEIIHAEQ
eukprot:NODE_226_length_13883_cov_0.528729.p4 type:complete len:478 gc:universal NODE_226_length_13883_cov_0.528729:1723-3156(+)